MSTLTQFIIDFGVYDALNVVCFFDFFVNEEMRPADESWTINIDIRLSLLFINEKCLILLNVTQRHCAFACVTLYRRMIINAHRSQLKIGSSEQVSIRNYHTRTPKRIRQNNFLSVPCVLPLLRCLCLCVSSVIENINCLCFSVVWFWHWPFVLTRTRNECVQLSSAARLTPSNSHFNLCASASTAAHSMCAARKYKFSRKKIQWNSTLGDNDIPTVAECNAAPAHFCSVLTDGDGMQRCKTNIVKSNKSMLVCVCMHRSCSEIWQNAVVARTHSKPTSREIASHRSYQNNS